MEKQKLARAFQHYLFNRELEQIYLEKLSQLADKTLSYHAKSDYLNCFDRWMIRLQESFLTHDKNSCLSHFPADIHNHYANARLDDYLNEKLEVEKVTAWLVEFVQQRQGEYEDSELPEAPVINTVSSPTNPDKLTVHINQGDLADLKTDKSERLKYFNETYGLDETAHLVLRYETLRLGSQQWGPPKSFYDLLYDEFGVRNELFGKPLISGLIEKPGTNVYTIFEEDTCVGCAGLAFREDLFKSSSGNWVVVCSFIDDLLDRTAEQIIGSLESGHECLFFCIYPSWKDRNLKSWTQLHESKFKLGEIVFPKGTFRVQERYGNEIKPHNSITVFLLGNIEIDNIDESMDRIKYSLSVNN